MWKVNVRLVVGAEKKQTFQASLYLIQEGVALAILCREAVLNRQRQDCYSSATSLLRNMVSYDNGSFVRGGRMLVST